MKRDINQMIFSRIRPARKKEIIESLTLAELLSITPDTVKDIIRKAGRKICQSRDKELWIPSFYRTGNSWNSTIESWRLIGRKVYIIFYVQYENTDTSASDSCENFIRQGVYRGEIRKDDRYGNPRTYYFNYDEGDKARAIRSLLYTYVEVRYQDKLKENGKK